MGSPACGGCPAGPDRFEFVGPFGPVCVSYGNDGYGGYKASGTREHFYCKDGRWFYHGFWNGQEHVNSGPLGIGICPWKVQNFAPFGVGYGRLLNSSECGTIEDPPQGEGRFCAYCNGDTKEWIIEGPFAQGETIPTKPGFPAIHCENSYDAAREWAIANCSGNQSRQCVWCNKETNEKRVTQFDEQLPPPWEFEFCSGDTLVISQFTCEPLPPPEDIPCCDKLAEILKKIGDCKGGISQQCGANINECCDKLDGCIDRVIDKINDKLRKVSKSCAQCKAEAGTSASQTLEYAVACAKYATRTCEAEIECKSSQDNGKPCTTCGTSPCCCKEGKCEPCEPKPPEQGDWCGWCDYTTGLYVVIRRGQNPPSNNYRLVVCGDEAAAVHLATNAECKKITPPTIPEPPQFPRFPTFGTPVCDLNIYAQPYRLGEFFAAAKSAEFNSSIVQTAEELAEQLSHDNAGNNVLSAAIKAIVGIELLPFALAPKVAESISSALGCNSEQWKALYVLESGMSYLEKKVGVDFGTAKLPWTYAKNALCRNRWLTGEQAISAYLTDTINFTTASVLGGMEGWCQDAFKWQIETRRSKPAMQDLFRMRHRQLISPSEYDKKMREIGFLEPDVRNDLFKTSEVIPPYSDLVRLMVRDAADRDVVEKFGLDDKFGDKFQGELRDWAKWQGVPDNVMRYMWRAHWSIPSPTQLFEFWHRLRHKPEFGGADRLMQDIKDALIQQDILPYWHDKFLAVSFRPLTRVDVRRGFDIGTINRDEVYDAYIDGGYSDENAERLTRFAEKQRELGARKHWALKLWIKQLITREQAIEYITTDGIPDDIANRAADVAASGFVSSPIAASFRRADISLDQFKSGLATYGVTTEATDAIAAALSYQIAVPPAIKAFRVGRSSRSAAAAKAIEYGMHHDIVDRLLDEAKEEQLNTTVKLCQNGIRKRFMLGEFDADAAIGLLTDGGTDSEYAEILVDGWKCQKSSVGRAIPAAKLCNWLEHGAITPEDFIQRLVRIGYHQADAALMVADCLQSISVKRMKQAEKEMKENAAAVRRAQQEQARQAAKARQEADRLKRLAEKAATTRRNREKQIASAAEKVYDKCDCTIYQAMEAVKEAKNQLENSFGFSIDDALAILLISADGWNGGTLADFWDHTNAIAVGSQSVGIEDIGEVSLVSSSRNGEISPLAPSTPFV